MDKWTTLASEESVQKTSQSLDDHNIKVVVVDNKEEAKQKVLEMVPEGSEVFTLTSVTLDTVGISEEINNSGRYKSIRNELMGMDRQTQGAQMKKLGATPQWAIGSVHAVTEEGEVIIASNTGSQLPAYAYGADHVIWVVGTQKIVRDRQEGFDRIYGHSLPLESERAKKAYGVPGSAVNKILIIDKEVAPDRITLIFVKEVLGF